MRRLTSTAAVVALILTAGGIAAGPALAGAAAPFGGSDAGGFTVPGPCPGGLQVVIGGGGNATHLGRYSWASVECFDPVSGGFAGLATLRAANGDTVSGPYRGQVYPTADPDVVTYRETLTITGGTGRFAGAAGELQVSGVADLATGAYRQSLTGWVSTPGSLRGGQG